MSRWGLTLAVAALIAGTASAQHVYTRAQVENGARLYQANCATCHGPRGDAIRGVALFSGQYRRASTDDELARLVIQGIPNTAMPPNNYSEDEAGMIVAYIRGVASGAGVDVRLGDAGRGKALFSGKGQCAGCHRAGSRLAPNLDDVGAIRRPLELEQAILDPSADLHADFRFVRAVARDGSVVTGRLMNQSTFSVQILDRSERLRGFDRADLREFVVTPTSEMPSYRGRLDDQEVADVVSYLAGLRGTR
jgi:putative heme-binding domain-containing protein